jgi:hypothetical protein
MSKPKSLALPCLCKHAADGPVYQRGGLLSHVALSALQHSSAIVNRIKSWLQGSLSKSCETMLMAG